jgi:tRNA U55 pseudouridine synthase TruB
VMDGTKLYRFTLRLGEARDTDDADGQVIATPNEHPYLVRALSGLVPVSNSGYM